MSDYVQLGVSHGLGHPFWPIAWHAKKSGRAGTTQLLWQVGLAQPKGAGCARPKETARHASPSC